MPAQQSQVPGGLGLGAALRSRAAAPVEPRADFSDLPGGIINGEARLSEAKIRQYKPGTANDKKGITGKDFVYLAGSIRSPAEVIETVKTWNAKLNNGKGAVEITGNRVVKIIGLRTNLTLPLCQTVRKVQGVDTVISAADNANAVLNELKMLGGEGCCASLSNLPANATDAQAKQALQLIMDALVKAKIRFRFGTRAGDPSATHPSPMVFHQWHGSEGVDQGGGENPATVAAAQTQDNSGDAPPDDPADVAAPPSDPDPDGAQTEADLGILLEIANDETHQDQGTAQNRLLKLAIDVGHDASFVEKLDSWEAVVKAINSPPSADEPPVEETWEPKKGDVCFYKPIDPKTKKPFIDLKTKKPKKPIEVEITSISKKNETADLLNSDDKKTVYKAVPWEDLITS